MQLSQQKYGERMIDYSFNEGLFKVLVEDRLYRRAL